MDIRLGKRLLQINFFALPDLDTWGITNRTQDNMFLYFADYDKVELDVVREDIRLLQQHFGLGTAMIRRSSRFYSKDPARRGLTVGNYHAIGFTKLTLPELQDMHRYVRCDQKFKRAGSFAQHRSWVLRIGPKIYQKSGKIKKPGTVLVDILPARSDKESSLGMIRFFRSDIALDDKKVYNFKPDNKTWEKLLIKNRVKEFKDLFEYVDSWGKVEVIPYVTR
jgi:hypothetical protein